MKYPNNIEKKIWDKMVGYTKSFLYLVGSLILMYAIIVFLL
jgi:hypothetical protein